MTMFDFIAERISKLRERLKQEESAEGRIYIDHLECLYLRVRIRELENLLVLTPNDILRKE